MSTIEIKNVSKSYGKNKALDDVSLTLTENCIYGLLGRNGAGTVSYTHLTLPTTPYV